ncbi:Cytochrome c oxidase subunit CcoQ [Devosia sp. DBB001]|nr:Cytochrome c oxidase subunit CcoQ [Devosia sp. DBB001]
MMELHDILVGMSKSLGLFYLIALSIGVVVYAYWPGNRKRFNSAAEQVVAEGEDRPCP